MAAQTSQDVWVRDGKIVGMRNSNHRAKSGKPATDFYRAFLSLERGRRRNVALRILRNQRLLADLYDHFLIQNALQEGGRSISWEAYKRAGKAVRS